MTNRHRSHWLHVLIWVLLWVVGIGAMMAWLGWHAIVAFLGLFDFDDPWLLSFGMVVLGLATAALHTFRDPSPWRVVAIAAFLGTAAAFVKTYGLAGLPTAIAFNVGGSRSHWLVRVLTVASYDDDSAGAGDW